MERSWVDRLTDDLAASRAELVGLAVLLVGGIVLTVVVVGQVPVVSPAGTVADVTAAVGGDGTDAAPVVPSVAPSPSPAPVVVHVTGAVRDPTVVTLPAGARVVDAVEAAGGAREDAALEVLNLAQVVADGQRLHVPTHDEVVAAKELDAAGTAPPTGPGGAWGMDTGDPDGAATQGEVPGVRTADGLLDLNLATALDLEELPGVGPVLSERIVAWRDDHGGFEEVGQLREVTGIGESRFQDVASLVAVP